jgi:hypothetical protein
VPESATRPQTDSLIGIEPTTLSLVSAITLRLSVSGFAVNSSPTSATYATAAGRAPSASVVTTVLLVSAMTLRALWR